MESISALASSMAQAAQSGRAEDFDALAVVLADARQAVRENLQQLTAGSVMEVVAKLEKNEPLTPEEKNAVRLWIIGDAESYARAENNYREWLEEFRRLTETVRQHAGTAATPEVLASLVGILEDLNRLVPDLTHYLENKERIARFEAAIGNLSPADGQIIASILKGMLTSDRM